MPGKLSIAGAVAATLMIPTALSAQVGGQIIGYLPGVRCRLQFVVMRWRTRCDGLGRWRKEDLRRWRLWGR